MGSSSSTSLIKELHKDLSNGIQYQASNLPKKNKLSKFFEKLDQDKNQALAKDEIAKFLNDLFYYVWQKVGTKRMAPFLVSNGKVSYYLAQPFVVPPTLGKRERALALIFQFMDMNDDNEIDRGEFIEGLQKLLLDVLLEPVFEEYQVESSSHKYSVNDEPPMFNRCYNGSIPIVDEENLTLLKNGQELVQVSEEEAQEYHRISQEQDWSQSNKKMNFEQIKKAVTKIEKSQIPFELCKLFRSVEKASTPEPKEATRYTDVVHGSKSKKWVVVEEDSIGKELSNIALTVKKGEVFRVFNDVGYFWFIGHDKTFTFRKGVVSRDILKEISQSEAEAILNK